MKDIPNECEELYLSVVSGLIVYSISFHYLCMCMTKSELIHNYMDEHLLKGICRGRSWSINGNLVLLHTDSYGMNILYVNVNIWNELCDMFSLTIEQTNDLFKDWVIRNYNISRDVTVTRGFF